MTGINRISISVMNMDRSLGFYRDILGLDVVSDMECGAETAQALWGMKKGGGARAVFLQNKTQPTIIELVEFENRGTRYMRDADRPFDPGLYSIALRVKDLEREYGALKEKHYRFLSPPCRYTADWVHVDIGEAVVIGPDREAVPLIQRLTNPVPIAGRFGDFTDSAQIVDDMDQAARFYQDMIGLQKLFDKELPAGMVNEILGVPPGTGVRMALFGEPGLPLVECIQYLGDSVPEPSIYNKNLPPDLGLFMITFETADLETVRERMMSGNVPVYSDLTLARDGIFPGTGSLIVRGPGGVLVRFL